MRHIRLFLMLLVVAIPLLELFSEPVFADDVVVEVRKVKLGPGGYAKWKRGDGEWQDINEGDSLKTCDRVKIARGQIRVRRVHSCENKQIFDTRFLGVEKTYFHISDESVNFTAGDGQSPVAVNEGGFVELYDGSARAVDGPACVSFGHCGFRGNWGTAVPIGSDITDFRCVQDSVLLTTTYYTNPFTAGTLATRARAGIDTLTTTNLLPGHAIRYGTTGLLPTPEVGLFVMPDDGELSAPAGSTAHFTVIVLNPDNVSHVISLAASLHGPSGWAVTPQVTNVNLGAGLNTSIQIAVQIPANAGGTMNIVEVTATSDGNDLASSCFSVDAVTPPATGTPTLSTWGFVALFLALALTAIRVMRRQTA